VVEEWKIIEDFPDYTISNYGRVFNGRRNRMIKANLDRYGYLRVSLGQNNRWMTRYIHRLVALAFVGGYFEGAMVKPIDGVKTNVMASNLEWVTQDDINRHIYTSGLSPRSFCIVETGDIFMYVYSCARYIGGDPDSILKCLNGTQQTHKGYHFEYIQRGGR
jgi:hypothetical protein